MAINLTKGQRINLIKENGTQLTQFCVGCNWGAIVRRSGFLGLGKTIEDVDLDLSCVIFDNKGELIDHIYSPLYRPEFLSRYGMPPGKVVSRDGGLRHSGDDLRGDRGGDDGLDNEIITVDLSRVAPEVSQIYFFLNNCGREDFSQIPYASIRMFEGTPAKVKEVFASYNVAAEPKYQGMTALIMGKLYRRGGEWKFSAIGDAFPDQNLCDTIRRIALSYAR